MKRWCDHMVTIVESNVVSRVLMLQDNDPGWKSAYIRAHFATNVTPVNATSPVAIRPTIREACELTAYDLRNNAGNLIVIPPHNRDITEVIDMDHPLQQASDRRRFGPSYLVKRDGTITTPDGHAWYKPHPDLVLHCECLVQILQYVDHIHDCAAKWDIPFNNVQRLVLTRIHELASSMKQFVDAQSKGDKNATFSAENHVSFCVNSLIGDSHFIV